MQQRLHLTSPPTTASGGQGRGGQTAPAGSRPARLTTRPVLRADHEDAPDTAAAGLVDEDRALVHERRLHGFAQNLDDAAVPGDEPEACQPRLLELDAAGDARVVNDGPTGKRLEATSSDLHAQHAVM